jgi:hypothetical protein
MLGPYIFSKRSNKVVSSVRGGRKIGVVLLTALTVGVTDTEAIVSAVSSSSSDESAAEASVSDGDSFKEDATGEVEALGWAIGVGLCFLSFFFLSLRERIVGGNCMGSPANISFFALNIGIQHTLNGRGLC